MPRLTRRVAARASLATAGTLVAALAARKWLPARSLPALAPPALAPPDGSAPQGERDLQGPAALRRVTPPVRPPRYGWQDVDGAGVARARSLADYSGRGVVLNIWATWCDPCVREMPSLAQLARALKPAGIAVLPVAIDRSGAAPVRLFFARHAIAGLPVLTDPDAAAMTSLGIGAIPVTLLIGPDGTVRGRLDGAADWAAANAAGTVRDLIGS